MSIIFRIDETNGCFRSCRCCGYAVTGVWTVKRRYREVHCWSRDERTKRQSIRVGWAKAEGIGNIAKSSLLCQRGSRLLGTDVHTRTISTTISIYCWGCLNVCTEQFDVNWQQKVEKRTRSVTDGKRRP